MAQLSPYKLPQFASLAIFSIYVCKKLSHDLHEIIKDQNDFTCVSNEFINMAQMEIHVTFKLTSNSTMDM
jgi:hypothetical protein